MYIYISKLPKFHFYNCLISGNLEIWKFGINSRFEFFKGILGDVKMKLPK